ncbi:two-component sensor histidine kinase [Frondihabitans sucicola]|uniref:histidine kinase n=1 Tax=Frondihabitans sucicola TaxID=1268041 RepID=A0ABN6XVP1_9MICO|nr:histidine kinase [Frondihabitans sucicola]BDZ49039.1 two-component sensor histidine kinase [Frondihabitans sucicola]
MAFWLFAGHVAGAHLTTPVIAISLVALVAWVVRAFTRENRLGDVSAVVMLLGGTTMVQATDALMITPAIIAVLAVTVDRRHPIAVGASFALVGAAIVTATSIAYGRPPSFLLGVLGGLAIGFVIGFNRRQTRIAAERERELLARDLEIDREQQRSSLLADRARVARDIHDVLAHSLGGLVIQLDAVEALLENGRTDDAAARVLAARQLAAEGLGEARRAVATLRDPDADPSPERDALGAPDALERLMAAHESLGGRSVVEGRSALDQLDPEHARAVAGVLRETLSNARRHAPGETVTLVFSLDRHRGILRFRVSNPVPASEAVSPGGGHGLPGMRERVAELGDASWVDAERRGAEFVIEERW